MKSLQEGIPGRVTQGSAHGRFQVFHLGHLEYVLAARQRSRFLWIGITQYDVSALQSNDIDPHRASALDNPMSYFERISMIKDVLLDEHIEAEDFGFVPFPIETPERLTNFLSKDVTCFTTVYEPWNLHKIDALRLNGYDVEVLWERRVKEVSGQSVRQMLMAGDERWKLLVPPATVRAVERFRIRERLLDLAPDS